MPTADRVELNGNTQIDPSRLFTAIDRFVGYRRTALTAVARVSDENFAISMNDQWKAIGRGNLIEGAESSRSGGRLVVTHRKTESGEDGSERYVDVKLMFDGSEATGLARVTASEVRFDTVDSMPRVLDTTIAWIDLSNGRLDVHRVVIPNFFEDKQPV